MSMVGCGNSATVFLKLSDFSMACENIHSHICDYLWCSWNSMQIIIVVASTIF